MPGSPLPESDELIFLLDSSLGSSKVLKALHIEGESVLLVDDLYPPSTPDEEWLTDAGNKGWVVLSKDKFIRKRVTERQALLDHNVAAFIFASGNVTGDEMAETLILALPRMKAFLQKHARPFIAKVVRSGDVSLYETNPQNR